MGQTQTLQLIPHRLTPVQKTHPKDPAVGHQRHRPPKPLKLQQMWRRARMKSQSACAAKRQMTPLTRRLLLKQQRL
jgi:hypothetical protein